MKRPWWLFVSFILMALLLLSWFLYLTHVGTPIYYGFDFGSALDAVALALVAIAIDFVYSKNSSEHQANTELLLVCVSDAKDAFRNMVKQSRDCESGKALSKSEQSSLMNAERELSNSVHSLEVALKECSADPVKLEFGRLRDARSEIKDSISDCDSSYPGPYDGVGISRIRVAQTRMRDELTRIAFAINRR